MLQVTVQFSTAALRHEHDSTHHETDASQPLQVRRHLLREADFSGASLGDQKVKN